MKGVHNYSYVVEEERQIDLDLEQAIQLEDTAVVGQSLVDVKILHKNWCARNLNQVLDTSDVPHFH